MTTEIRLMLVDDHTLFREGTRMLMETREGCKVVAEAGSGGEAIEQVRLHKPDVIAMDIAMEGMDGLDATIAIKKENSDAKIIALTMHGEDEVFYRTLRAGVSSYVPKESPAEELVETVVVAKGGYYITPQMTRRLVTQFLKVSPSADAGYNYSDLTERELEVLRMIGEGMTNREIAENLNLTVRTVQTHRTHIMQKLDLHNRAELMRGAVHLSLSGDPGANRDGEA
ncbi:MAG: response regulator transcription factor [Chloroflexota bacterium]|nr:response regulator transcription factor [Chloroflexota bacterium]